MRCGFGRIFLFTNCEKEFCFWASSNYLFPECLLSLLETKGLVREKINPKSVTFLLESMDCVRMEGRGLRKSPELLTLKLTRKSRCPLTPTMAPSEPLPICNRLCLPSPFGGHEPERQCLPFSEASLINRRLMEPGGVTLALMSISSLRIPASAYPKDCPLPICE